MKFSDLDLIWPLAKALEKQGFTKATEIQEKVIPLAKKWKDILGCAQTGSGKTLAFALPTIQSLYNKRFAKNLPDGKHKRYIQSLILVPTRELAVQIFDTLAPYCMNSNFKHTAIYGWVNDFHQIKAIEKWVDILIATPGRLEDLISQWVVKLSNVEVLTLDEADRMLVMGWLPDIKKILKRIPEKRQSFFFSATMPKAVRELSDTILKKPVHVTVHTVSSTTDKITQQVYNINRNYKRQLLQQIAKRKDLKSIIVFVNTIDESERVFEFLKSAWIACDYLNKNKTQNWRQKTLQALKDWNIKVMIATDIASRWLDVSELSCVVNYDIPREAETYVHRIGRTWRAGKSGLAISMCTSHDIDNLKNIEKLIDKKLEVIKDDSYKEERVPKWQTEKTKKINEKNRPRRKWKKRHYGKK